MASYTSLKQALSLLGATLLALPVPAFAQGGGAQVKLLAPLGGSDSVSVQPGAGTFIEYFNQVSGWLISAAVGFCVIWVLIGGMKIMTSGGDSGARSEGQDYIKWAIMGLIILLFTGFILRTLNSQFYK